MKDWQARIVRTLLQWLAGGVSGGGVMVLVDQLVTDVNSEYVPYILITSFLIGTIAQNVLEELEVIPTILKPASPPAPAVVEPVQ